MRNDSDAYYGGGDDAAPDSDSDTTKPATPEKTKPTDKDNEEMESETAMLPKSIFEGKIPEVGDICKFKAEHIWENEVEVSWVDDKGGKHGKSTMDTATDAFDQMAAPTKGGGGGY